VKSSSTLDSLPLSLIVDTRVKERLTGAIILVGVLVLLVPELLTGPKRVPQTSEASADEPPLRSYTIELNEDGSQKAVPPAPTVDASESVEPMGANSEMIDDSSEAVVDESALDANASSGELGADTLADEKAAAAESDVPVASVPMRAASDDRAKAVADRPVPAKVQPKGSTQAERGGASDDQRTAARATTSPADDRAEQSASKATVAKSAAASGSAPKSTASNDSASKLAQSKEAPKESAPKASAAKADSAKGSASQKKGSRWAIQVGSFASRANADRLAGELKGKGFSAFVSEGTSGGKKLFRVRVGPEADKAAAQSLAARLRAAGRPGSLVPQS
jgi:cell division septation protein DedD